MSANVSKDTICKLIKVGEGVLQFEKPKQIMLFAGFPNHHHNQLQCVSWPRWRQWSEAEIKDNGQKTAPGRIAHDHDDHDDYDDEAHDGDDHDGYDEEAHDDDDYDG